MHRSVTLILGCILTLGTALALLGLSQTLRTAPPGSLDLVMPDANRALIRQFYNAAHTVLADGETTALDAVLAPDFIEHTPLPDATPDRTGLEHYLAALHANDPGLRLTGNAMDAEADEVLVSVAVLSSNHPDFIGAPWLGPVPVWGTVDRFRIADGQIVEHWSDANLTLVQVRARVAIPVAPPATDVIDWVRASYPPLAVHHDQTWFGPQLACVDAGTIAVHVDPAGTAPQRSAQSPIVNTTGTTVSLGPGMALEAAKGECFFVPRGVTMAFTNIGNQTAVVVRAAVNATGSAGASAQSIPSGGIWDDPSGPLISTQDLAEWPPLALPAGIDLLTMGRFFLAPGAELPAQVAVGPELLAVERGTLDLTVAAGPAWVCRGDDTVPQAITTGRSTSPAVGDGTPTASSPASLTVTTRVAAGDSVLLDTGAVASLRNLGPEPVVVQVLTLGPATVVSSRHTAS